MGLNQSLMSGANIFAPLVSGALIDRRLYATWALSMAVTAACGAIAATGRLASSRPATLDKSHARPEPI
jgi:hypothetical protein